VSLLVRAGVDQQNQLGWYWTGPTRTVCVTTCRSRPAISTWLVLDRADSDRLCHYVPESTSRINLAGTGQGRLGPSVSLRAGADQPYQLAWYWPEPTRTTAEAAVEISFTGARLGPSGRLGFPGWTAGGANLILAGPDYHASYAPSPRYSWEPAVTYRRAIRSYH
jgi:hypothetical protein